MVAVARKEAKKEAVMSRALRILVGTDMCGHYRLFADALAKKAQSGFPLEFKVANIARHDWLSTIEPFDVVMWHPNWMMPKASSRLRERVYFMEKYLRKTVVPNFNSVWHFESKVAESYLFATYGVHTPPTVASFDYTDAFDQIDRAAFPLVHKLPYGSGSENVRMVKTRREARRIVTKAFCHEMWVDAKAKFGSRWRAVLHGVGSMWFWYKIFQRITREEARGAVYWQEFVPGNTRDLRITVIGDRYAYGFWRNNRPHDFRASGSGLIDYQSAVPEETLRYCLDLNRRVGFDSMAYDILFTSNGFVITEMSFGYDARAMYNTPGHYERNENGTLSFVPGYVWAQDLWVEWAIHRAQIERDQRGAGGGGS
jgi:glutathione synthase/RimK-type ligase-like ATP-grasp enzyme